MAGGHGELFVQTFDRKKLTATGPIVNLSPGRGDKVDAPLVVGPAPRRWWRRAIRRGNADAAFSQ